MTLESEYDRKVREAAIAAGAERLRRLWAMNPQIDPRCEFENTFEGLRYWHMAEHPEVYGRTAA